MKAIGMQLLHASTAFALIISPVSASAESIVVLSRSAPWEINYDNEACHLIGTFGGKDDEVIVRFSKSEHSDLFRLAFYGKPFASKVRDNVLSLDFGQAKGPAIVNAQAGMAGQRPVMITQTMFVASGKPELLKLSLDEMRKLQAKPSAPTVDPERDAAVNRLIVGLPSKQSINLQLGSMGAPMASMRTCLEDLIKSWGYDPQVIAAISRRPSPVNSPGNWLTVADYPKDALLKGKSGIVRFRLDVDNSGKVTRCAILDLAAGPEFVQATCSKLMKRARFEPALDANGKPIAAYFTSSVNWMYPTL